MIAGEQAPDFTLLDHTGRPRTLSDLLVDGPVVLFFFPMASSPICTAQACHFRDLRDEFARLGAQRIGISTDTVDRQAHFAKQRSFDYPLLSDLDGVVSELFGVRRGRLAKLRSSFAGESARRGRHSRRRGLLSRFMPVRRVTFVIDTDRTVVKVVAKETRAAVHADETLRFLQHEFASRGQQAKGERAPAAGAELALETPIEALAAPTTSPHWSKYDVRSQLLSYCAERPSIAEISARLSLPLGATRYLVDDLVTQGYLRVHAPRGDAMSIDERRELLTRTLAGLRAL